jgi:hypothetical protein
MFRFNSCAKILKKLLINEIRIFYLYIHCALSATSKFNFEPLFNLIKILKGYLKPYLIF